MPSSYDVLVIGAGVVGCSIAHALSRAGMKTLNIDALPAAGYGSTSHSSAIVRPFYSHITSCAVAHESRSRWLQWPQFLEVEDPDGYAQYAETGGLILFNEADRASYNQNLTILDAVGVEYEILDSAGVLAQYPTISLQNFGPPKRLDDELFGISGQDPICGGIYIPACGHVSDPQLAARNLQTAAVARGAKFRFGSRITEILRSTNKVYGLRTDSAEEIHAPVIVNAAGPHSSIVNALAGITDQLSISTRPHRHEVAYLATPPGYAAKKHGFMVDMDTGIYQRGDGANLLIGSADPACDPVDIVDPDDYQDSFSEQWTLQVYRAALRSPDLLIESKARGTVGLYDVSDDWIPIYDKTDLDGFYLAIGTSGNQFKNAPIIGDIMASIILAGLSGADHDMTPQSLQLPGLDRSVDLSFYSRNRQLQQTQSVMA